MGTLWFLLLYPSNNSIWWAGCNLGCDQVVSVPQSEALPRPSQKCCRLLQLARSLPVQPSPCRSVILTARNKCVSHTARCSLARLWPYLTKVAAAACSDCCKGWHPPVYSGRGRRLQEACASHQQHRELQERPRQLRAAAQRQVAALRVNPLQKRQVPGICNSGRPCMHPLS